MLFLVVLFLVAAGTGLAVTRPPPAAGADAAPGTFSSARAMRVLERILGDGAPHPTATAANAAVRDRIVAELQGIGLEPEVRSRFACGGFTCATVENILAHLPGTGRHSGGALLLSAHYDSVPASPGASDDVAGVAAIIEAVRALRSGPPLARDTWVLINDGEELGLVGAEAFTREPEFARIDRVVNLEARGTTGPSLLIETQAGNAAVAALVRRALPHPAASSLEYEIYRTLPNDTDFTVYRREGLAGANFAWAEGAARYHTPLDDLAHLDPRSMQHHGTHVLSMARAFAAEAADPHAGRDAVFLTLPGGVMAGWPTAWNPALLLVAAVAWLGWAWRLWRNGQLPAARAAGACVLTSLALAALVVLALALHAILRHMGAMPATWTAQGGMLTACFLALAPSVLLPAGAAIRRVCGEAALALATLLPFLLAAGAATAWMPGAVYMGLLPLLAAVLPAHLAPARTALWPALAAALAVLLYIPYAAGAYDAIGHEGLVAASVLGGIALLPLLPVLLQRPRLPIPLTLVAVLLLVALAMAALARPAFDHSVPRQVNLAHVDDGRTARVFVLPRAVLPIDFRRDAGLAGERAPMLPWGSTGIPGPEGPRVPTPALELASHEAGDGAQRVVVRVASRRGARELGLVVPGSVALDTVRIDGQPLAPSRWHADAAQWRQLTVAGAPAGGVTFELELPPGPVTLHAFDRSNGLPSAFDPLVRARDAIGVPVGNGDTTLALARLELRGDALPRPAP